MIPFDKAVAALSSSDASERNSAAIMLMDLGNPVAVPPLIAAIECGENRQSRGTLIYALSAFDCSGRFEQLFSWALDGGFEASCEALSIIRDQKLRPTSQEFGRCLRAVRAASSSEADDELVEELEALLEDENR